MKCKATGYNYRKPDERGGTHPVGQAGKGKFGLRPQWLEESGVTFLLILFGIPFEVCVELFSASGVRATTAIRHRETLHAFLAALSLCALVFSALSKRHNKRTQWGA